MTSGSRASTRTREVSTPACTEAAHGPSGRWPASDRPRTPTTGTSTCSKTGQNGLSTDFDLPTLLGYDSDHEVYRREIGKIGVAIDTVVDMHALFDGIPLDEISTSLTINPSAAILLAMYRVVA